ncbi:MAG TPA: hypothetical protein VF727_00995 [Allosphingosinicella sp.]|jgi:hypothetical protein
MQEPTILIAMAGFTAAGLALTSAAALRAWAEWLQLRRQALHRPGPAGRGEGLAELKARVRRLEAIADGVDV